MKKYFYVNFFPKKFSKNTEDVVEIDNLDYVKLSCYCFFNTF